MRELIPKETRSIFIYNVNVMINCNCKDQYRNVYIKENLVQSSIKSHEQS